MDVIEIIKNRIKELRELYESGALKPYLSQVKIYPTLTEEKMRIVEERLGFKLPNLLRRFYLEISNGGCGIGYGLLSFEDKEKSGYGVDIIGTYEHFLKYSTYDPVWKWPEKLLPICDWGCGIYTFVDCSTAGGATISFDPNPLVHGEPLDHYFNPETTSIEQWFLDKLEKPNQDLDEDEDSVPL